MYAVAIALRETHDLSVNRKKNITSYTYYAYKYYTNILVDLMPRAFTTTQLKEVQRHDTVNIRFQTKPQHLLLPEFESFVHYNHITQIFLVAIDCITS